MVGRVRCREETDAGSNGPGKVKDQYRRGIAAGRHEELNEGQGEPPRGAAHYHDMHQDELKAPTKHLGAAAPDGANKEGAAAGAEAHGRPPQRRRSSGSGSPGTQRATPA